MRDISGVTSTRLVKARRAHSMPSSSHFVLPSEDMGEYNEVSSRRRSAPARPQGGMLYPLREEGRYGAPPAAPPPPLPEYRRRERKPKVYSSYAVNPECDVHADKLARSDRDHGMADVRRRRPSSGSSTASRKPSWASNASVRSRRTVSASPSRRTSRTSASPEPTAAARKYSAPVKAPPTYSSTAWSTTSSSSSSSASYNGNNNNRFSNGYSSYRNGGSSLRDSSFEENEEYEYVENQKRMMMNNRMVASKPPIRAGFGKYAPTSELSRKLSGMSLDGLRKPEVNSWDSMGILGLSNKMWSDHKKRQESFMETTGHFLREDKFDSYIM